MPSDSDFLTVRLGIGKVKLCVEVKSRANTDGFVMEDDELEELAGQIIEETRYVENVPVRVSLKEQRTVEYRGRKGGCLLSAAQHARGACDHAQLPGCPHHWPVRERTP